MRAARLIRRFNMMLTTLVFAALVVNFAIRREWFASVFFLVLLLAWRLVFVPRLERRIQAWSSRK